MVSQLHKHYLVWYKQKLIERRKTCISDLSFLKRMTCFQKRIEWLLECPVCAPQWGLLFNLEKNVFDRSNWTSFKMLKMNAMYWVEQFEHLALSGVR